MSGRARGRAAQHRPPPETTREEFRRRLTAVEAHLADLEDRLNDRGVFSGDSGPDEHGPGLFPAEEAIRDA